MNFMAIWTLVFLMSCSVMNAYSEEVIKTREDAQLFMKQLVEKGKLDFLYESPHGWGVHSQLSDELGKVTFAPSGVLKVKASDEGCVTKLTMRNFSTSDGEYDYYFLPRNDPTLAFTWQHIEEPEGNNGYVEIYSLNNKNNIFTGNFRLYANNVSDNIKLAQALKLLRKSCILGSMRGLF